MAKTLSSTLCYQATSWALFPFALAYTLYLTLKYKRPNYLFQRLSIYKQPHLPQRPIWCHCASVGEINTALPLLKALIDQGEPLLITTNTVTGYDNLTRAKLNNSHHAYLPLDYNYFSQRFIKTFQPRLCFIFETELWPSVLLTTINNAIPMAFLNGRISDKTLKAPKFLQNNYQKILANAHTIVASSEDNKSRFISLGANPSTITTLDNLKFANLSIDTQLVHTRPLAHSYLLCASTHEGEEQDIIKAWLRQPQKQLGLVVAIRHPQRSNDVVQLLNQHNCQYSLHSQTQNHQSSIDCIHIIDTLGELIPFIAHAEIVFMGGSLVPVGGHNMIEPAAFKRCILIGPYYDDFKYIVEDLKSHNAIEIVENAEQLIQAALSLNLDNRKRTVMGNHAYSYIQSKRQVLSDYVNVIQKILMDHKP